MSVFKESEPFWDLVYTRCIHKFTCLHAKMTLQQKVHIVRPSVLEAVALLPFHRFTPRCVADAMGTAPVWWLSEALIPSHQFIGHSHKEYFMYALRACSHHLSSDFFEEEVCLLRIGKANVVFFAYCFRAVYHSSQADTMSFHNMWICVTDSSQEAEQYVLSCLALIGLSDLPVCFRLSFFLRKEERWF